jgi:tetratricopeptide (TPR) repeat protein
LSRTDGENLRSLGPAREGRANSAIFKEGWMMNSMAERPVMEAEENVLEDYRKIQGLISGGNDEEAMAGLEEFLWSFPDHSLAHDDLGVLYFRKGDKDRAGDHFLKSLEADPANWNAAKNLADLLVGQGQMEDAFQFYQRVLAERPDDEEALLGVAVVCRETGLGEDAEFFYRRLQEVRSRSSSASTPLRGPEDSPAHRSTMASLPPQGLPFPQLTPAMKEKQACFSPSSGHLRRNGETLLEEEEMEESGWLLKEVLVTHPAPGACR